MTFQSFRIVRWICSICCAGLLFGMASRQADGYEWVEQSPLRALVRGYVKLHPDATLEEVAAFANEWLPVLGLNYEFVMFEAPPNRTVTLEADSGSIVIELPDEIDRGPCGELWATAAAVHSSPESIDLILRTEKLTVPRPADLLLDSMTIYSADQQTVLTRIDMPWSDTPHAVLPDGRGVVIDFKLFDGFDDWWKRVTAAHRQITRRYPSLLIEVDAEGVRFVTDPARYADEPIEDIDEFPGSDEFVDRHRWRYLRSGLVVEFDMPCA